MFFHGTHATRSRKLERTHRGNNMRKAYDAANFGFANDKFCVPNEIMIKHKQTVCDCRAQKWI